MNSLTPHIENCGIKFYLSIDLNFTHAWTSLSLRLCHCFKVFLVWTLSDWNQFPVKPRQRMALLRLSRFNICPKSILGGKYILLLVAHGWRGPPSPAPRILALHCTEHNLTDGGCGGGGQLGPYAVSLLSLSYSPAAAGALSGAICC